jgi:hypothetical protein
MKTVTIGIAVGALLGVLLCNPGHAQTVAFPKLANSYTTWMARAMDQCNPAMVSVAGAGLPSGGCVQSNTATDDVMTMNFARLIVSARTGRVLVFGRGLPYGSRTRVRLTLRVTKPGVTTKHNGLIRVTFEDTTVDCPNATTTPFGYTGRPNGVLLGSSNLADCLGSSDSGLARGNIEILSSELVNVDTGKTYARPGIFR